MGKPSAPSTSKHDEELARAKQFHMKGKTAEAKRLYNSILRAVPKHAEALHYAGILEHQLGQGKRAATMISQSLALSPGRADWHCNYGNVLQQQRKLDEAVTAYKTALELDPYHAFAHNNLGVLLRAQGDLDGAEEHYRTAVAYSPDFADAHHNLGTLLASVGETEEAVRCLQLALSIKTGNPEARRKLAIAYCKLGQYDKAVAVCQEWLAQYPGDPLALHALASIPGQQAPERASDAYVEQTFDGFAQSFEVQLAKLEYRAPALIAAALTELGLPEDKSLDVLDAGCGTGLCGPLIAPYSRRLTGVDLSEGMLQHAREKAVYDELLKAELTAYLEGKRGRFDVVVSADTLVYFGALENVAAAAAGALRDGGHFVFTVEETVDESVASGFSLKPHGRYNHRADYVRQCLEEAGLTADMKRAHLRMEAGAPVDGLVVTARKAPTSN